MKLKIFGSGISHHTAQRGLITCQFHPWMEQQSRDPDGPLSDCAEMAVKELLLASGSWTRGGGFVVSQ